MQERVTCPKCGANVSFEAEIKMRREWFEQYPSRAARHAAEKEKRDREFEEEEARIEAEWQRKQDEATVFWDTLFPKWLRYTLAVLFIVFVIWGTIVSA